MRRGRRGTDKKERVREWERRIRESERESKERDGKGGTNEKD